jgi:hypothetical protein
VISEVLIEDTATAAEIGAVAGCFSAVGYDGEVLAAYGRRSIELLPWIVYVTLSVPIAAFTASFGAEAGKDAYAAFKEWLSLVFDARRGSGNGSGAIELVDPAGTRLILATRTSDEALDGLANVDWETKAGHYLVWDEALHEWRDPTKRAQ